MNLRYRPEIDGLRACAVISVLLFHLRVGVSGGFVGVDVFFVISGYLITHIIQNEFTQTGAFNFTRFYLHRIRRLLPALFVTLAVTWVLAFLLLTLGHFRLFNHSLITAALSLSNLHFLGEDGYFDGDPFNRPLLHTWSLGVEMQFYLLWPLLILLLLKYANVARTLKIIALCGCVSLLADMLIIHTDILPTYGFSIKAVGFYFTPLRVYEFAIGAALVWLIRYQPKSRWMSEALFFSGLGLIALAAYFFTETTAFPSYNALLPCLGAALVIYSINASAGKKLLSFGPVNYVGKISYSIYLCHWPLIVFYFYYKRFYTETAVTAAEKGILVALTFLLAALMYHFIERPWRLGSAQTAGSPKDATPSPLPTYATFAALSALLVAIAGMGLQQDGWPGRTSFAPEFTKRYNNLGNFSSAWWAGRKCDNGCELNPSLPHHTWVIGDSFAMHLKDGLVNIFPDRSFSFIHNTCKFYSLEICPIEEGPLRPGILREKNKTLDAIKRTSDDVIISHYWDVESVAEGDKNLEEYIDFRVSELKKIKSYLPNNRLIVIGTLPVYTLNPIYCLGLPDFISQKTNHDCLKEDAKVQNRRIDLNAGLAKKFKNTGISFVSPTDYFCDKTYCRISEGDTIFVFDSYHLSTDGSIRFIDKAQDIIR